MSIYRRIYEHHHGPIPKDDQGRSYEIHHIDGDRTNNDISNLKCVSIQEHYDIHYDQGEYGAANMIAKRMHSSMDSCMLSEIAHLSNIDRVKQGTHNFSNTELHAEYTRIAIERKTHVTQNSAIQSTKGKKGAAASKPKRIERFIADNPNNRMKTCEHCGITTTAPVIGRRHGPKCKSLEQSQFSNTLPIRN